MTPEEERDLRAFLEAQAETIIVLMDGQRSLTEIVGGLSSMVTDLQGRVNALER